jgi:hypothetical protein
MIVTENKPWEEVKAALEDYKAKNIVLVSCNVCAAKVGTGGTEGAKKMEDKLRENGYSVSTTIVVDEPCDDRMVKQAFRKIKDEINSSDVVLSLACGLGTQAMNKVMRDKFPKKAALTALNTVFMGETERFGIYKEACRACGECILNETGGVCPITHCAKSMLNGPCGGSVDGKCEVGDYTQPCGWVEIYDALESIDRLDLFLKVRDPRDWSESGHQRDLNMRVKSTEMTGGESHE